ncbi:MAG: hypothetical protein K6E85_03600 [Lachnospiraceae bacterium]|nr:hypothetical protein [Lachnospiraceae bacterium]
MNEELEKAYEADKERKQNRTDELQAARDYVGVLLDEAEGKNAQLEDKTQEAEELFERLRKKEGEIDELIRVAESEKKKNKFATFWMFFALAELLMIVVVAVILIIHSGSLTGKKNDDNADGQSVGNVSETDNGQHVEIEQKVVTQKYSENLKEKVDSIKASQIAPFTADIKVIDGLEYLVFSTDNISVAYKNEYYLDEMSYRKSTVIDNGTERYTSSRGYDLTGDLTDLVPKLTNLGGRRMLAFTEYNSRVSANIPSVIRVVDCESFRTYSCSSLMDMIKALTVVEESEELSVYEDAPIVYTLTTSKAVYKYAIDEGYYNEIAYNEYALPNIDDDFVIKIDDEGISWKTSVKLGTELYLGGLSGGIKVENEGLTIESAKYGAFVPANIEDPELKGYIRPAASVPERYLTIGGYNDERFYVSVNEEIPKNDYNWDRLNTDDPNDWYYVDTDGNKISIRGIDVSKYQANINWKKVAEAGVEFAIIRMGYRGMNEGTLELDPYFDKNVQNALANNIKVGIYFFSQAITEKEAREEADFVLKAIGKYKIEYPVIFDTERVTTYNARANGLNMETRTTLCRVFCEKIREAGYTPMIYANTKYMVMGIDQTKLTDIDKWFAVYTDNITYPYDFQMLQYSESGSVPGVTGNVDLNISFVDYSAAAQEGDTQ